MLEDLFKGLDSLSLPSWFLMIIVVLIVGTVVFRIVQGKLHADKTNDLILQNNQGIIRLEGRIKGLSDKIEHGELTEALCEIIKKYAYGSKRSIFGKLITLSKEIKRENRFDHGTSKVKFLAFSKTIEMLFDETDQELIKFPGMKKYDILTSYKLDIIRKDNYKQVWDLYNNIRDSTSEEAIVSHTEDFFNIIYQRIREKTGEILKLNNGRV